jgi:hypothetical protein
MAETGNVYIVLVGKPERKEALERPRRRNAKIILKHILGK